MIINKPSLVFIRNRKLLMARSIGQNLFYIPGGKMEDNETTFECLIREAKEELGVNLIASSMNEIFVIKAPAHNKPYGTFVKCICITSDIEGEPVASKEIEEIRFLDSKDNALVPAAGALILKRLKELNLID